jgi:hypothetical protein
MITKMKRENTIKCDFDVEKVLNVLHKEDDNYLENNTMQTIINNTFSVLDGLNIGKIEKRAICDKLAEYRLVDKICYLHLGKHVRWLRKRDDDTYYLTNGGAVADILFEDVGIIVLVKTYNNRFFKYRFDDCLTFQILTDSEKVILMATEIANV